MNVGEDSGAAKRFLRELDAPDFYVGMDPTLAVADAYGVRGMPQSIFIDADGIIRAVYVGQLDEDLMREYFRAASLGTDEADRPGPLRFVTTVARERALEVDPLDGGRVEFRSKSLRCDDAYCATPVVDTLSAPRACSRWRDISTGIRPWWWSHSTNARRPLRPLLTSSRKTS